MKGERTGSFRRTLNVPSGSQDARGCARRACRRDRDPRRGAAAGAIGTIEVQLFYRSNAALSRPAIRQSAKDTVLFEFRSARKWYFHTLVAADVTPINYLYLHLLDWQPQHETTRQLCAAAENGSPLESRVKSADTEMVLAFGVAVVRHGCGGAARIRFRVIPGSPVGRALAPVFGIVYAGRGFIEPASAPPPPTPIPLRDTREGPERPRRGGAERGANIDMMALWPDVSIRRT